MNENQLLAMIADLKQQNKALKKSLANIMDRLAVATSMKDRTMWEIPVFDRDFELEEAHNLLVPTGAGKNLQ
jgi:formylmethanofuran:tetrahydromethanopterin formyltransferase